MVIGGVDATVTKINVKKLQKKEAELKKIQKEEDVERRFGCV